MKTKRSSSAKRGRATTTRKHAVRRRPVHKRVLLHPFTAFVLLCVGVLTIGSTFRGQAESYDVTATVPAPAVTEPAAITQPTNGQHVGAEPITVQGTCPPQSYVKLYRDGVFSGAAICNSGQFAIQTSLSPGGNELKTRVFNLTDNEGPAGSPQTVYYDLPVAVTPPPAVPVSLSVVNLDEQAYQSNEVGEVRDNPTVSGYAPPFSDIEVTFYSEPSVCKTKANALGVWTCTLAHSLPPGLHHVVVVATTPSGKKLTMPTFQIKVVEYAEPFTLVSDYKYQARRQGQEASWTMAIRGGTPPFTLLVDWGDGSTSRIAQPDHSEFEISHTYNNQAMADTDYNVVLTATDARGATAVLQVTATMKGAAAAAGANGGTFQTLLGNIRQWLWVVWPVYIAVLLMALSYWIGEREAYQRFMVRRRMGRPRPHIGRR